VINRPLKASGKMCFRSIPIRRRPRKALSNVERVAAGSRKNEGGRGSVKEQRLHKQITEGVGGIMRPLTEIKIEKRES